MLGSWERSLAIAGLSLASTGFFATMLTHGLVLAGVIIALMPPLRSGMQLAEAEVKSLTTGPRPTPHERWQRWLKAGRLVINRAI